MSSSVCCCGCDTGENGDARVYTNVSSAAAAAAGGLCVAVVARRRAGIPPGLCGERPPGRSWCPGLWSWLVTSTKRLPTGLDGRARCLSSSQGKWAERAACRSRRSWSNRVRKSRVDALPGEPGARVSSNRTEYGESIARRAGRRSACAHAFFGPLDLTGSIEQKSFLHFSSFFSSLSFLLNSS